MSEFDAEYERLVAEARGRTRGRNDVLDYLDLRATNDALRTGGVEWLLQTFTALAGEANRAGACLTFTRADAHRFRVGNSTMVGEQLVLRVGVRSLTVEAGWPRTPRDGIVGGGGLACAQVSHFGNRAAGEEILLVASESGAARWLVLDKTSTRSEFSEESARRHLTKLLDEK
ncbi:MAG: hypothetical protein LC754_10015 [Acidobacteria bacterium]|nr:hypothetical protein [Acidobacteriota bacterium]